jgi:small subunit ribosomal protein S16
VAVRIRLRRLGAKKRPFYRVVVADQRSPRDGRFIEAIGKYHPLEDPSLIEIDEERALEWLKKGAQPSEAVQNLMTKVGIWEKFEAERPKAAKKPAGKKSSSPKTAASKTKATSTTTATATATKSGS